MDVLLNLGIIIKPSILINLRSSSIGIFYGKCDGYASHVGSMPRVVAAKLPAQIDSALWTTMQKQNSMRTRNECLYIIMNRVL